MIVVVTALIGPTGSLARPAFAHRDVRWVCYTDRSNVEGWELRALVTERPRREARQIKTSVDELFPEVATIWADASFDLLISPLEIVADAAKTKCQIVGFAHPDRSRIRDEAAEIIRLGLAPKENVLEQVEAYRRDGFDTDANPQRSLTTTGFLVRWPTQSVAAFNQLWAQQIERYTLRDQLSVDYCAWRSGVPIGRLAGHYRSNRYARYNRERHHERRVDV